MCGIFGQVSNDKINVANLRQLALFAVQRGSDSSGLIFDSPKGYEVFRANSSIKALFDKSISKQASVAFGHSRLITNGLSDNQPVIRNNMAVVHNGIVVNDGEIWPQLSVQRQYQVDSEVIVAIAEEYLQSYDCLEGVTDRILTMCKGVIACALALPDKGKLLLFSNNGSLFLGSIGQDKYFSSEKYPLEQIGCQDIQQVRNSVILDIPIHSQDMIVSESDEQNINFIPTLQSNKHEESLLEYKHVELKRCSKCILPSTMPYIYFDDNGVCNYCHSYKVRNKPKPKEELFSLVESYRRNDQADCIVPFSGGRDSCYALHLIVKELEMQPITYTYDWGMVTDLGRRNISRMCAELGVENIIIAADINKKRQNIRKNLMAWLKSPDLGMMSILTAGDKHFFQHVETVKQQTGIDLNLWGVNPLEVTHFKAGFLGIKPDFEEKMVYSNGALKQMRYQYKRFKAMLKSPGYFNASIWDTLSGEYYRSFTEKKDYFHIFDYWRWDENIVNDTLMLYDWEKAIDTNTTWRIGDGTAAFYNYVYYTVAGFTEHDTFRSNQIREGEISRHDALQLIQDENRPRYANIRWYLDTLHMDYQNVIKVVNAIPKLYELKDEHLVYI